MLALFAPDATWTADGGGKAGAAAVPIVGAGNIARLVLGLREKFWAVDRMIEVATVNGETGLCLRDGHRLTATMSIATDGERILAVYAVVNPDKWPRKKIASTFVRSGPPLAGFPSVIVGCLEMMLESVRM